MRTAGLLVVPDVPVDLCTPVVPDSLRVLTSVPVTGLWAPVVPVVERTAPVPLFNVRVRFVGLTPVDSLVFLVSVTCVCVLLLTLGSSVEVVFLIAVLVAGEE